MNQEKLSVTENLIEEDFTDESQYFIVKNKNVEVIANNNKITPEEWLTLRRSSIGGSGASAILGLSKYATPLSLWADKLYGSPEINNDYVKWGNILEPVIRSQFKDYLLDAGKIKSRVYESPFMYRSKTHPFMTANIDGIVITDQGLGGLEIKTATILQAKDWGADELPDAYYCQVQHYMAVLDLPWFYVVCLLGKKLIHRFVPRNDVFIYDLVKAEDDFWTNFVEPKVMPAPSGMDADEDTLKRLNFERTDNPPADLTGLEQDITEYLAIKQQMKQLEQIEKKIKQDILFSLGNYSTGICGDHKVTMKNYQRLSIDTKKLKEKYPEIIKDFERVSDSWRFTVR